MSNLGYEPHVAAGLNLPALWLSCASEHLLLSIPTSPALDYLRMQYLFIGDMAYGDEDEVDWSDGSLHAPSPTSPIEAAVGPSYLDQRVQAEHDRDSMVRPDVHEEHIVTCGLPLDSSLLNSNSTSQDPSRTNRARHDVRPSRRLPSKKDYSNFILYQASQKAYEATFLNAFVAHALHPEQIAQCCREGSHARPTIEDYLRTITRDIDHITKKIVWNAHCRTVHLLANDRKHGAPFLDVRTITSEPFSDYGPNNLFPVADRMSKSWHHVSENPSMIRFSKDNYDLAHEIGPLEELDKVSNTLLCRGNFHKILPADRAVRLPGFKKRKGEHSCGAAVREGPVVAPRMNWLTFPQHSSLPVVKRSTTEPAHDTDIRNYVHVSPMLLASHDVQDGDPPAGPSVEPTECQPDTAQHPLSHLGEVFGRYGNSIFDSDLSNSPAPTDDITHMEKVNSWRLKLVKDHKQRLVRKWGYPLQTNDEMVMSTREAVAAAIALGFRLTNSDYQEQFDISVAEDLRKMREEFSHQIDGAGGANTIVPTIDAHTNPPGIRRPAKKRRIMEGAAAGGQTAVIASTKQHRLTTESMNKSLINPRPQVPHPSGSWTLEEHQEIPPNAYFEPQSIDEKQAWRCGIKHALGYYYNSGDCKSSRKTSSRCHNAVAKDAYWEAISVGVTEDEARQVAVNTVLEWLKPKRIPRAPTPEPELELKPEPDLGPHVSGSTTMEHRQEIPEGHYWQKRDRHEEYAWRCDVSHAFGRYYLAGDRKSCPGCGSSRHGNGRRQTMDFYLPTGVIVRQDAPGLSIWKPHALKPGKVFKSKNSPVTHNQMCSKAYHDIIAQGCGAEEASKLAVDKVDNELDRRQEENLKRQEDRENQEISDVPEETTTINTSPVRNGSVSTDQTGSSDTSQYVGNSSRDSETTPVPRKRKADEMSDSKMDEAEAEEYQTSGHAWSTQMPGNADETSSDDDEESSGSDSE
ncbi:hypothetical protein PTNB73_07777 [Pyrenophora teres f. teres]|nr:hypothetical protein HRS9122_07027 [Pyrenophora teres f. teres]KAE8860167.1 hypothetical protein PTNB73_07777 [Pyrenophora teres f. teres]